MKFIVFYLLSILTTTERPVTEDVLNDAIRSLAEEMKEDVIRIITATENQYLSHLQNEIKRAQVADSLSISRKFDEIQTMIRNLQRNGNTTNFTNVPGLNNQPGLNNTTGAPEEAISYIIPIFLKLMKCNNCFSCRRDEVCFYYVFMYVLPLILNQNGQPGGDPNNTNNAIFQTLMNSMNGFNRNTYPNAYPTVFPPNNFNQQQVQQPPNLLQSLFNFMFNDNLGTNPNCGPAPTFGVPQAPPVYGPTPNVRPPVYGPTVPSRPAYPKPNTRQGGVTYGPCPPGFNRREPEYHDAQECTPSGCVRN